MSNTQRKPLALLPQLLAAAITVASASAAQAAPVWNIDSAHSDAGFSIKHLMISNVKGSFTNVNGTVEYDGKNPIAYLNKLKIGIKDQTASK